MSTINLLDALSKLLNCEVVALHDYLNHPLAGNKINEFLKDKNIRTTYFNREMEQKIIKFGGISLMSANLQRAYEGYLGVTVQQHFYCRHRIRLMYPRLRCVIEYGNRAHNKYYPLELLELFSHSPEVKLSKALEDEDKTNDCCQKDFEMSISNNQSHISSLEGKENGGKLVIDESQWAFVETPDTSQKTAQPNFDDALKYSWYNCYSKN